VSTENKHSFSGKGLFPVKYAFTLLLPIRKFILSPKKLLKQLNPKDHSTILEVGPGPGFFSSTIAKAIPNGLLTLFDIQESMLNIARKRLTKKGLTNVDYIASNGKSFPFQDDQFDIIFMVTVLGEVHNKNEYLKEFQRVIKENGIVAVSEQAGDPDLMSVDALTELFVANGFKLANKYGNKLYYTLIFQPVSS
jgi:ubiquinone/menaquinone biosynthesis C-methylase UbiE